MQFTSDWDEFANAADMLINEIPEDRPQKLGTDPELFVSVWTFKFKRVPCTDRVDDVKLKFVSPGTVLVSIFSTIPSTIESTDFTCEGPVMLFLIDDIEFTPPKIVVAVFCGSFSVVARVLLDEFVPLFVVLESNMRVYCANPVFKVVSVTVLGSETRRLTN